MVLNTLALRDVGRALEQPWAPAHFALLGGMSAWIASMPRGRAQVVGVGMGLASTLLITTTLGQGWWSAAVVAGEWILVAAVCAVIECRFAAGAKAGEEQVS